MLKGVKLNPKFESQIYKFYDLNKLENNYAEGVVIKLFEENNVFNKEQENRIIFLKILKVSQSTH